MVHCGYMFACVHVFLLGLVKKKTMVLDLDETLIHSHHDGLAFILSRLHNTLCTLDVIILHNRTFCKLGKFVNICILKIRGLMPVFTYVAGVPYQNHFLGLR